MGGRTRVLVDDLDLAVDPGEAVAIVGESGSGKSITARALSGVLPPGVEASGSIRIGDEEFAGAREGRWRSARGRRVALLPQDPFTMLSPLRTAGDQVRDGARSGFTDAELHARLAEVGIRDPAVARSYPFELSGGLRQRVGIAAALAGDPDVLIADEPSTALDVTTQRRVLQLLTRLRRDRGMALVLITHDLRVAFATCSRVYVLYAGALLEVGEASGLEDRALHPYTNALLLCEPSAEARLEELRGIPGRVPPAEEVLDRCAFASRCDWCTDACLSERPALVELADGRQTACRRIAEIEPALRAARVAVATADVGTAAPRGVVLDATDLRKTFPARRRRPEVRALAGVSLEVGVGESVGVVGESGSGKTTLARIVAGLETADSGSVVLPGAERHPNKPSPVQVVFQDPAATLNPARRVRDQLADALRAAGRPCDATAVGALLTLVGLPVEFAPRKPAALSGGERQRVAIARALAPEPRLLLCDEPVSALDVSVQAQVLSLFRDIRDRLGVALLFITHDLAVVRQVADRIYVLRDGAVVEHGSVSAVLDRPRHEYTRELIASVPRSGSTWLEPEPTATTV